MSANQHLKRARALKGWSQQQVAEAIGTTHVNVSRWERGITSPYTFFHQKLCELFGMDAVALGLIKEDGEITEEPISATEPGAIYDHTLPVPFTTSALVGRDQLIADLRQFLSNDAASIALNGLPGVGKTALAITLASDPSLRARFSGGILWAALGPKPNVSEIFSRWGALFEIAASGMGPLKNNDVWGRTLRETIGTRRMLIIIDDAWDIEATTALKVGGPHCTYLVTTRFPHVAASFAMKGAIKVSELSEEDGILLLHHLTPEVATYDADMVRALVRSVGALPLALKLVGKYLYVQMYTEQPRRFRLALERLQQAEHRLRLSEPSSPADIHTYLPTGIPISLQAVIAVSDEHLDEQARQALRALSLFPAKPNTFSEEAALAISEASIEVLDVLSDAGLLEINGRGRYTLHQAIVDYARLQQNEENASERFTAYYKVYLEAHRTNIEALELESQNIFSALEMMYALDDHMTFVQGIFALTNFLLRRGLYEQAKLYLTQAYIILQIKGDVNNITHCYHHLGMVAQKQGEYQQATTSYQEALALAREANDKEHVCSLLADLGWVSGKRGRYEQASTYALEGLSLTDQINNEAQRCRLLTVLGVIADNRNAYLQAEKYYQEGLTIARKIADQEQECILLIDLGVNADYRGADKERHHFATEALRVARQIGHLEWQCLILSNLCGYYEDMEDYEQSSVYNQEALLLARQLGHREWLSFSLLCQGVLAIRGTDYTQAETALQEGLKLAVQIEKPLYVCEILKRLGNLALLRNQFDRAAGYFSEMQQRIPDGQQGLKADALYRTALVAAVKGDHEEAKMLGDAALLMMEEIGFHLSGKVRLWVEEGYPPSLPVSLY